MAAHFPLLHTPPSLSAKTLHFYRSKPTTPSFSSYPKRHKGLYGLSTTICSSSNGRDPNSVDSGAKSVEKLVEGKRRAELSARIASGEFTVEQSGFPSGAKKSLSKLGVPSEILEFLFSWVDGHEDCPKIPEAKGAISAIRSEAFFIPLYELFLTYGGIFRLNFGPKYVAAMISLFGQATDRLCKKLDAAASDGEDVEMESLFSRLTLDIIGKAVFNYDFDSLTNDTGIIEAVYTVLREAEDRSVSPIPVWEIPIWKDISPRQKRVSAALKLINDILDDLIAICKRMVDEEELQFHEEYVNEQDPSILHFLLASGDDEPSVVSKLQEEVDSVLGDRFPTIEDMKKLKYATRVINESLRLYPQPPVLIRRSLENDVLGGYPIKRGEDIFISVWNLHRSPKIWDDAEKFKPERWPLDGPNPNETNQNFSWLKNVANLISNGGQLTFVLSDDGAIVAQKEGVPFTPILLGYLPFGGGPRKCVGDMFASYETVVALAMLVRRFNFQIALGAPPVEMTTGATIHTTEGLKMTVTRRIKPPIVPTLEMLTLNAGASVNLSEGDALLGQKGEVSSAHS
ncbi:protein lutein deficient 5 [Quercus suber]|uniref:Protein lutein deficient 5 n=1 Tax=Quercus suber TaxID=58331 RepID=A0AAW0LP84_QUESU